MSNKPTADFGNTTSIKQLEAQRHQQMVRAGAGMMEKKLQEELRKFGPKPGAR